MKNALHDLLALLLHAFLVAWRGIGARGAWRGIGLEAPTNRAARRAAYRRDRARQTNRVNTPTKQTAPRIGARGIGAT